MCGGGVANQSVHHNQYITPAWRKCLFWSMLGIQVFEFLLKLYFAVKVTLSVACHCIHTYHVST